MLETFLPSLGITIVALVIFFGLFSWRHQVTAFFATTGFLVFAYFFSDKFPVVPKYTGLGDPVLVVASFWFWFLFALVSCAVIYLISDLDWEENQYDQGSGRGALAILLFWAGILQLFSYLQPFSYVWYHPWLSFGWAVAYLIPGLAYATLRIFRFAKKREKKYFKERDEFLTRHKITDTTIPEANRREWENVGRLAEKPRIQDHKATMFRWVFLWPWSAFWYVFGDLLDDLWEVIFSLFQKGWQAVIDRVWRRVEAEHKRFSVAETPTETSKRRGGIS